jgi:hypothetical protein
MAKRARKRSPGPWWAIAALIVAAGLLVWWLSARRAEAPGLPASQPGARALSEVPEAGDHDHDEISGEEKADLERIIRDRGAASPGR